MTIQFKGLLFDLDGTLVDSNAAVDRSWMQWCERNGINFAVAATIYHGRPAGDSIKELLQGASDEKIEEEIRWLQHKESTDLEGVIVLPGTIDLLTKVNQLNIPWAIVTSGTMPVATARIKAAGILQPPVLVTPERVSNGKPDPEPFILGAHELGLSPEECIVFEDAPSGLNAGNASGAKTIAVLSQFKADDLPTASACVPSLAYIELESDSDGLFSLIVK
jgi:sugar-phosphatase